MAAIFYGEAQIPADELKGSDVRKGNRIADRLIYTKLGARCTATAAQRVRKRKSNRKKRLPFSLFRDFWGSQRLPDPIKGSS